MNESKRKVMYLLKLQEQIEKLIADNYSSIFLDDSEDKIISKLRDLVYQVQRKTYKACKEVK